MSSESFSSEGGHGQFPDGDEFEEMLEILISVAQSEGHGFLAYLLRMALMEARNHGAPNIYLSH